MGQLLLSCLKAKWKWDNKKKKIHRRAKCPPSRFWSTGIKEEKKKRGWREEIKRGWVGTTADCVLLLTPHPPPVPLAHPAVISLWGMADSCQQLSCFCSIDPLEHAVASASNAACHAGSINPPSPFSKGRTEAWKYENARRRGLWRRQFPPWPESVSHVEENKTSLWCSPATELQWLDFCWNSCRVANRLKEY